MKWRTDPDEESRVHSGPVRRMQAGESPSALARELKLRRKLLYEWRGGVFVHRAMTSPQGEIGIDPLCQAGAGLFSLNVELSRIPVSHFWGALHSLSPNFPGPSS